MMIIENISLNRRQFLGGILSTGAFVVVSRLAPEELFAQNGQTRPRSSTPRPTPPRFTRACYLGIEPDGTVFIVTHRSEMGTGIRTSLPLVAADELDADWKPLPHRAGRRRQRYGDRTPTDRDRFATSTTRSESRARRRSRCSSAPPQRR